MNHPAIKQHKDLPLSKRFAKRVVSGMGSWKFISIQATSMLLWALWNLLAPPGWRFDEFPFILLNLVLSTQAAFAAPLILIAQSDSDTMMRDLAEHDHTILKDIYDMVRH